MMTIREAFAETAGIGHRALIPYLTAGYPSAEEFVELISACLLEGADLVEIGVPFSDPLADGPTIQQSSQQALADGMSAKKTLSLLRRVRNPHGRPIVIMSYFNPILRYGIKKFLSDSFSVGVRGLIIPDIICEEGKAVERAAQEAGVDLIYLLAPTSTDERRRMILKRSRGFVYLVTVAGVTGVRRELPEKLHEWIRTARRECPIPVAAGFGISNPEQARLVAQAADGVVVGSAIIDVLRNGGSAVGRVARAHQFVKRLKAATATYRR